MTAIDEYRRTHQQYNDRYAAFLRDEGVKTAIAVAAGGQPTDFMKFFKATPATDRWMIRSYMTNIWHLLDNGLTLAEAERSATARIQLVFTDRAFQEAHRTANFWDGFRPGIPIILLALSGMKLGLVSKAAEVAQYIPAKQAGGQYVETAPTAESQQAKTEITTLPAAAPGVTAQNLKSALPLLVGAAAILFFFIS
jgi:hypothetical protein